uniref:Uncharacterized protein n=1 Tax=Ditylenchus dipsaci TaxID=166011 RepID=A0A915DJ87_9BILA
MSLACTYIRKHQYSQYISQQQQAHKQDDKHCTHSIGNYSVSKALRGQFLLMFTPDTGNCLASPTMQLIYWVNLWQRRWTSSAYQWTSSAYQVDFKILQAAQVDFYCISSGLKSS